jgi:RimJ/RimL family protein N-acetyltransferase
MSYYKKLVGQRVYLSPFDTDNEEIITKWTAWMNDKTVAENYGGTPHHLVTRAHAKTTIGNLTGYRFSIVLLEDDAFIGHISLHNVDSINRNAFLGIVIGDAENRGKGYGEEAIRLAVNYGFKTLNFHSIALSVHSDMPAAIACYQKVGFKEVGRMREWVFKNGRYVDKILMEILDSEFV